MKINRVGVDIAKSVFHVYAVDRHEQSQLQAKLNRGDWLNKLCVRLLPNAEVGMEACASSHHWGRELQRRGFRVKLIAAQFVKPYVKSNKNDRVDAEAICEAMSRPGMRFVSVKTVVQQDIQAMHRIRADLVGQRTAKANQIRGLVGEYGIVAPRGIHQLRRALPCWLEDAENGLSDIFRGLLADLREDLQGLDERIAQLDSIIARSIDGDPLAQRLLVLRGVGPLTASALVSALGDGTSFRKGRDFAASLGLWARASTRHQQARRSVSEKATRARRSIGTPTYEETRRCAEQLGQRAVESKARKCRCRSIGQQDGACCLGARGWPHV
jgi:transposase